MRLPGEIMANNIRVGPILLTGMICWSAAAQTQLDLQRQAKNVNFSSASSTAPLKTGTSLPATCAVGQMFFLTTAPAGINVYGCTGSNTWALEGGSSGGTGSMTFESSVVMIGARPVENFVPGLGLLTILTDTGAQINVQQSLDTAVALTRVQDQSGGDLLCASSSGSPSAYTCAMSPTLTSYSTGMALHWKPDVGCAGGRRHSTSIRWERRR
jgi:hypothetical protein